MKNAAVSDNISVNQRTFIFFFQLSVLKTKIFDFLWNTCLKYNFLTEYKTMHFYRSVFLLNKFLCRQEHVIVFMCIYINVDDWIYLHICPTKRHLLLFYWRYPVSWHFWPRPEWHCDIPKKKAISTVLLWRRRRLTWRAGVCAKCIHNRNIL